MKSVVRTTPRVDGRECIEELLIELLQEVYEDNVTSVAIAIERPRGQVSHRFAQSRWSDSVRMLGAVARLLQMIQSRLDDRAQEQESK